MRRTWAVSLFLFVGLSILFVDLYGIVLALHASIIMGILVLFFQPLPLFIGMLGIAGHPELCERFVHWIMDGQA